MQFIESIIHLLIPRPSNNHKARLLYKSSLLAIAGFLVVFQGIISFLPRLRPNILGYASQISPDEVVRLTNEKRALAGLSALSLNTTLSSAAFAKGRDMIDRDYWAHTSPDGTTPWKFFNDFGYRYRYAGENLARDFSNSSSAVDAWMGSPTHKDNLLNPKYKEIGIGVVEGDLAGVDTTIIVQFFGTTYVDQVTQPVAKVIETTPSPVPVAVITSPQPTQQILVSPFTTTRVFSIILVAILLMVFIVDGIIVSRRKIVRIGGRTIAHISFLGMILAIIMILRSGRIL